MSPTPTRILVGMSGGVDSSVAAALLVREGYHVTGAFMVNFDSNDNEVYDVNDLDLECWRDDYRDAVRVAAHLEIPLIRLDFRAAYQQFVLDYMFKEYEQGRTPNPDVLCNQYIKFDAWVVKAKELGFDALATGHYARLRREVTSNKSQKTNYLVRAKDENKDQTYFLHQLTQEQLGYSMFPLGAYTKDEVRALAREFDLPTAEKAESMGVCFVGEMPMNDFLMKKIQPKPGAIVFGNDVVVGEHKGLPFYTIGQRHIGQVDMSKIVTPGEDAKPLYVVGKQEETNTVYIGFEEDTRLFSKVAYVQDMHWIGDCPAFPYTCKVRLRHRQELQDVTVVQKDDSIELHFADAQRAVTPGQFAVLYRDDVCLGGGVLG